MSNEKTIQAYWDTIADSRKARSRMSDAEVVLAERLKPLVIEGWQQGDEVTATFHDGFFHDTGTYADYTDRESHSEVIDLFTPSYGTRHPMAYFVGEWSFVNHSLRKREEAAKVDA